ncbi:MAG: membrane protein insertion efficiency factor YidD [Simkania sp.]|nr:membrane protein insertion efficiency factor YidD [Simkania sp.]MCB1083113.1 membrane protein insertion efficiency factor YidD [Simkania sp.]MCP5489616.1 membrane protein insertion efficiency factor YidD [Chlamydiales bacterium]
MGFKIQFLIVFFCVATATLSAEIGYQEPWGKDAELVLRQSRIPSVPTTKGIWTKLAEQVILFHQNVLSPVDGPRSHFRPTSSRYMLLAMRRHGFIKGFVMGCDRLLRENKEEWVYRTITIDGETFKWDPTY